MSEQCQFIQAAYPTMADDPMMCAGHRHDPRVFALARAMAEIFQKPEPTDEQIAWFLDDADAIVDDFPPEQEQWAILDGEYPKESGLDHQFTLNGIAYVVQASDWEPAHPVKRETYESWVGVDDYDEDDDADD